MIAIPATSFAPDFFRLSTGLAGEIVQKFVNYRFRLVIMGDFLNSFPRALRLGTFSTRPTKGTRYGLWVQC